MTQIFHSISIGSCLLASSCATIKADSKPYELSAAGFAQVERAPASTRPKLPKSEPFDYHSDSLRRWAQQSEFETEATELRQTLEAQETGNFVQLRIE